MNPATISPHSTMAGAVLLCCLIAVARVAAVELVVVVVVVYNTQLWTPTSLMPLAQ